MLWWTHLHWQRHEFFLLFVSLTFNFSISKWFSSNSTDKKETATIIENKLELFYTYIIYVWFNDLSVHASNFRSTPIPYYAMHWIHRKKKSGFSLSLCQGYQKQRYLELGFRCAAAHPFARNISWIMDQRVEIEIKTNKSPHEPTTRNKHSRPAE